METDWRQLKRLAARCKLNRQLVEAANYLAQASELVVKSSPQNAALVFNSLADTYMELDQFSLAEKASRDSVRMELEFGDFDRWGNRLGSYYVMLARALEKQKRFHEALDSADKAVEVFVRVLGADDDYVRDVSKYRNSLRENRWRG